MILIMLWTAPLCHLLLKGLFFLKLCPIVILCESLQCVIHELLLITMVLSVGGRHHYELGIWSRLVWANSWHHSLILKWLVNNGCLLFLRLIVKFWIWNLFLNGLLRRINMLLQIYDWIFLNNANAAVISLSTLFRLAGWMRGRIEVLSGHGRVIGCASQGLRQIFILFLRLRKERGKQVALRILL